MFKVLVLYLLVLFNTTANDGCLFSSYTGNGTCSDITSLLADNMIINTEKIKRNELLKKKLGHIIRNKALETTRNIGKVDQLFNTLGSDGLAASIECNLSEYAKELGCVDDEYFKTLFPNDDGDKDLNKEGFVDSLIAAFRSENDPTNISGDISDNGQCVGGALRREHDWQNNFDMFNSPLIVREFIDDLNKAKDESNGMDILDTKFTFIKEYYPDIVNDIKNDSFTIPEPIAGDTGVTFLKRMLENNKSMIESRTKSQCTKMKDMIKEGLCIKLTGSELNNPELSSQFFGYSTMFQEDKFDEDNAFDNGETDIEHSFTQFAANCYKDNCTDSCIQFDDFFSRHEIDTIELSNLTQIDADDDRSPEETLLDAKLCREINCKNYIEMKANENLTCERRASEELSVSSLESEFSCVENPAQEVCGYLRTITQVRTVNQSRGVLSTFAQSVLGQNISTTINTNTTNISTDIGINEEAVRSFDEAVRQSASETFENTNNTPEPATAAATAAPTTRSSAAKAPTQTRNNNTEVRTTRTAGSILDNSPISTDTITTSTEEEYTEEETSLIGSLRDAISSTITDIGDAAKRAVTPRESTPAVSENTAARLGETTAAAGSTGVSADDTFSSDFRENSLAVQPGNAPEGFDGMQEETVASGDGSLTTGVRSLVAGGDTGRAVASVGDGAQNTGYVDVNNELLQSISLTAGELEVLDEARIRELNIPMTEPFVLMINVSGRDVPVKVRQIAQGGSFVLRPLIDESNQEVEDELRKAPIFASYFNSPVMRTKGLEILLDGE